MIYHLKSLYQEYAEIEFNKKDKSNRFYPVAFVFFIYKIKSCSFCKRHKVLLILPFYHTFQSADRKP